MIRRKLQDNPEVTVVIPSCDGHRDGNVPRLLLDLERQDFRSMEMIVVVGIRPQGRAINMGAAQAQGRILVIMDDDSRAPSADTIGNLVRVLDGNPDVGMAGASIVPPTDANRLQRLTAREFPRFCMPIVTALTDSDMPCHGCCAMRRAVFDDVGGERENLARGLDPDLRQRIRDRGHRVVLAPRTWATHPLPPDWRSFARRFYRNGRGSASAHRRHPELLYDTDETVRWDGRRLQACFFWRIFRFPLRTLGHLLRGRLLRAAADFFYALGYLREVTRLKNDRRRRLCAHSTSFPN
jgi:GT2 family glycosyltransferase